MPTLAQVSDVQLGHTVRARLEVADVDGIPAFQLRDVRPDGQASRIGITRYRMTAVPDRYWARAGDVLFRSRGDKNTATALGAEFSEGAVVVMPLFILRPKSDRIDSGYLAWCINQPSAQRHFDECARGTGMRMIPVGCLASLPIPLPDLATQRAITEVADLAAREQQLATRLADKRRQLTAFALHDRANRTSSNQNGANRVCAPRSGKQGDP